MSRLSHDKERAPYKQDLWTRLESNRLDLAATAAGLGATGLTFFDDEVTRFFEPAAAGRQVVYLTALGRDS